MIVARFVYGWYLHVTSEQYCPPSDHLVSIVLVVTWRIVRTNGSQQINYRTWKRTQVEVVVLSVTDGDQKDNGVDDGYMTTKVSS